MLNFRKPEAPCQAVQGQMLQTFLCQQFTKVLHSGRLRSYSQILIKLAYKGLLGRKTIAYYEYLLIMYVKSLKHLTPGPNVTELFLCNLRISIISLSVCL
jgi:hypothetical protein